MTLWQYMYGNVLNLLCKPCTCNIDSIVLRQYNRIPDVEYKYCKLTSEELKSRNLTFDRICDLLKYNELFFLFEGLYDYSPIHYASFYGMDVYILRKLISKGCDIESKTKHGQTPLHVAVLGNNIECVRILLEQNANIEALDDGTISHQRFTPLLYAMGCEDLEIAHLLLNNGANAHVY